MTFKPRGLVVTAAGAAILWAILQTKTIARFDSAIGVAICLAIVVLSVAAVRGMRRRGDFAAFGPDAARRELVRWFRSYLHRVKAST